MMRRSRCRFLALGLACLLAVLALLPAAAEGTERYDHIAALNPMIRLNGDGLQGLTDGEAVTKWLDTSGHSVNAVKVPDVKTGAGTGKPFSSPTLKKNALNGHDAVVFDRAASAALVLPGAGFGGKKQYTVVAVYRTEMTSSETDPIEASMVAEQFVLRQRMGCNLGLGVLKSYPGYTTELGYAYGASAARNAQGAWGGMSSGMAADTGYHIQTVVYDSESGSLTCYVDGTAVATREMEAFPTGPADATDYVWIGNDWRGNAGLMGEIAEIAVFDTAFDGKGVDQIGRYLAAVYGLSYTADAGNTLPYSLIGVQNRIADDGLDLRFILSVNSVHFRAIGVMVSRDGAEAETIRSNTVYPAIHSGEGILRAEDLGSAYLGALPVTGLPLTGTVTLTVTPLFERADGTTVTGFFYTIVYTDGAFVSASVKGAEA